MMRRLLFIAGALLFLRASAPAADPTVWSALLLGTWEDHPKEPPAELRKFNTKLENVFGYNQFELIGQHAEVMDDPRERWLIPSRNFCLSVQTKTGARTGYLLKMELFEDQQMLTHFEANLGAQSPLFIRGPLYAGGQLIIIMMIK